MLKQVLLLLTIVFAIGCVSDSNPNNSVIVILNNKTIYVEVADSPEEWQKGLMFRESLAENKGMLFIFPEEAPRSFWMKNTKISLGAIFISADLTVVNIETMEPCYEDPCRTYQSQGSAKYVLEVNKDVAQQNGIVTGSKISIGWPE